MYGWRNFLLRQFGAQIGQGVLVRPTVRITYPWQLKIGDRAWIGDFVELYNLGDIEIGADAVVSQNSYLCTGSHDYSVPSFDIYAKPIVIEPEAWVAADVFVGPGVRVGRGAVIGARSTLLQDAPEYMIMAAEPGCFDRVPHISVHNRIRQLPITRGLSNMSHSRYRRIGYACGRPNKGGRR